MIGTIHVCAGCQHPDRNRRTKEPAGRQMVPALRTLIGEAGLSESLEIDAYSCLGHCQRRCRISLGGGDRWSWLLGDLAPDTLPVELGAFLKRWIAAPDGFLHKDQRPESVRRLLIGRVPPLPSNRR